MNLDTDHFAVTLPRSIPKLLPSPTLCPWLERA
jgi:hypothetical protein